MSSDDKEPRGDQPRDDGADSPSEPKKPEGAVSRDEDVDGEKPAESPGDSPVESPEESVETAAEEGKKSSKATYYDDPYDNYDYEYDDPAIDKGDEKDEKALAKTEPESAKPPPPPLPPTTDLDDDEEEGMARMSFLEHLEELRSRIIRAAIGMTVAYSVALAFAPDLFKLFVRPFDRAVSDLPYDPPLSLTQITPTEQFYLEYVKIPLLAAVFIGAPWLMMQAWGFISPGLYKRERRWALPFIFSTAGLFILGGLFCYFIALRFALAFLMGLAFEPGVRPMISLTSYYDMFFNLHVGLGAVFEMPIVIFFFTLLRITSPSFLFRNGRYAILIIFIIAAVITPTPDVTTMLTFAAPMVALYYLGIAVSYLIVLKREGKKFPWKTFWLIVIGTLIVIAAIVAVMHYELGYQFSPSWPFYVAPQ